jgi:hypothetical protein
MDCTVRLKIGYASFELESFIRSLRSSVVYNRVAYFVRDMSASTGAHPSDNK